MNNQLNSSENHHSYPRNLDTAEYNFDIIIEVADEVVKETLLGRFSGNALNEILELHELVRDLKTIFSFIRRAIRTQERAKPSFSGCQVAAKDAKFPSNILTAHPCICPLTILLRWVAKVLTSHRNNATSELLGKIAPLQAILKKQLDKRLKRPKDSSSKSLHWTGVASCIMFHEEESQFTVTSSAVNYQYLAGMARFGKEVREGYMNSMLNRCPSDILVQIRVVEQHSADFIEYVKNCNKTSQSRKESVERFIENSWENRKTVSGTGATFKPNGDYMLACLVEFVRFNMQLPPLAQEQEKDVAVFSRQIFTKTSCAEWEFWITKHSQTRSQTPRNPNVKYDLPKSHDFRIEGTPSRALSWNANAWFSSTQDTSGYGHTTAAPLEQSSSYPSTISTQAFHGFSSFSSSSTQTSTDYGDNTTVFSGQASASTSEPLASSTGNSYYQNTSGTAPYPYPSSFLTQDSTSFPYTPSEQASASTYQPLVSNTSNNYTTSRAPYTLYYAATGGYCAVDPNAPSPA